ncbi:MAG: hypothetical protein R3D02_04420 [Hyphomicrobiales bacterium]
MRFADEGHRTDRSALAGALADRPDTAAVTAADIRPLADTGLAHWHARIGETGWLARMP